MPWLKNAFWKLLPYFSTWARVIVYDYKLQQQRLSAWEQFHNTTVSADSPSMAFEGNVVTVLQQSDSSIMGNSGACENYSLTVIARNPHGQHFIFISNGDNPTGPYIKPLSQEHAEIALKSISKKPA